MSDVSFIERLLDGVEVEWRPLGDVVNMRAGQHISASNIMDEASKEHPYPCFGGNGIRGFVAKNSHDGKHLLIGRQGALCGNVQRTQGKFYATEHAVVVTPSDGINVDWAFHLLTLMNLNQYASKSAQPGLAVGIIQSLEIPIPCPNNPQKSLEIQAEIVRILDAFTAMTAELTAELNLRKQQYNYYRDQLLSFEEGEVEWKTLGDVLHMRAGQHISASKIMSNASDEHSYPCFGGNGIRGFVESKSHDGDHLLIGRQGALCGNVQRMKGQFYATEHAVVVTSSGEIDIDWAFHMLTVMNLNQYASQSAQPGLAVGKLQGLTIPVPSLAEQKRIANILDKFDALTNSITEGLPREIELRQKQYEYYRDLLLSFRNSVAEEIA
ncbi:restriction endonuclease subunit S [Thalassolituus sp. UBA3500]|uniref:restriction endonuclease subunit S n=1 Tax=Thalassolituus sp. UBA3500 TaxID=1947664 RepID=UPI000C0FC970|nr:restriction endonuclease subunit S [Thalassolituus sp. UBA3500]MBN56319.1 restriction endonuclease subunit S [Oceanospirillaceae bacterium]|tara:strand:+ start:646 stop:1791 length:1146 start_codon:yes stop_codon:yes gene_type:complete